MDPLTIALYVVGGVLALLLARGLWILKKSGDARIEQTKAMAKAREGRNPDDALTYHQKTEQKALEYIKKIPLVRLAFRYF